MNTLIPSISHFISAKLNYFINCFIDILELYLKVIEIVILFNAAKANVIPNEKTSDSE